MLGLVWISIHALREEGDPYMPEVFHDVMKFLSTPSARRATSHLLRRAVLDLISIHALREEGDEINAEIDKYVDLFLSTPSARRATHGG